MLSTLDSFDKILFNLINSHYFHESIDPLMLLLSDTKVWGLVFTVPFILVIFVRKLRPTFSSWLFASVVTFALVDSISFRIIKASTKRFRPCYQIEDTRLVAKSCGGNYSFPSNHAANSMGIAAVSLVFFGTTVGAICFFLAAAVGYSRIYLGVHFPFDVLVGFCLGLIVGITVAKCLLYVKPRFFNK